MTQLIAPNLFTVSEVELVYHSKISPTDRPVINSARSAYDVFLNAWDKNKIQMIEQFNILLLNRGNYCLGYSNISTGGIYTCIVDPKIVFATAIKANATSMIVAHNHPSGSLKPSTADIALTEKLVSVGKMLDLHILDHLIITPYNFYSFADEGLIYR